MFINTCCPIYLSYSATEIMNSSIHRLTFPGKLKDSELEEYSGKFDADAKAFIIRCKKDTEGEHFPNLDMLTKLLAPQGATAINKPSIEVISKKSSNFLHLHHY